MEARQAGSLAVLRRAAQAASRPAVRPGERCELCGEPIDGEHGHLVDLQVRQLLCACRGCHLLFAPEGAGGGRYRAVPSRYLALDGLELTPEQWDALQIPVSVAFFFVNSSLQRVAAFYPGPAGATESLLALDSWDSIAVSHPALQAMLPDVEALLVRRAAPGGAGGQRDSECYIVPIDACYELVGQLRLLWRGFDGGSEAHRALEAYFERVARAARKAAGQEAVR